MIGLLETFPHGTVGIRGMDTDLGTTRGVDTSEYNPSAVSRTVLTQHSRHVHMKMRFV